MPALAGVLVTSDAVINGSQGDCLADHIEREDAQFLEADAGLAHVRTLFGAHET
jgi:hypothetical protein